MTSILLKPKEVTVLDQDGTRRQFIISRLPALKGRKLVTQYPLTAMPKIGDYTSNEALCLELMAFVEAVKEDGTTVRLTTSALVDNHAGDWECLARLEVAMMEYNVSFFGNGKALNFFEAIATKAQALLSRTLTDLSARSSPADKPH